MAPLSFFWGTFSSGVLLSGSGWFGVDWLTLTVYVYLRAQHFSLFFWFLPTDALGPLISECKVNVLSARNVCSRRQRAKWRTNKDAQISKIGTTEKFTATLLHSVTLVHWVQSIGSAHTTTTIDTRMWQCVKEWMKMYRKNRSCWHISTTDTHISTFPQTEKHLHNDLEMALSDTF